jgi:hypothetical protein
VEGPSDKILFETLSVCKWAIDLNRKGIVIIDCAGKGGVKYFTGVCVLLGLNYFSVWDNDNQELNELNIEDKLLIDFIDNGRGLELSCDLEDILRKYDTSLKLSNSSNEKVQQSYDWAFNTKNWPNEFNKIKDFFDLE